MAATATALALPLVASCGVNFDAQTDQPYTPGDGVNFREGQVDVLNALVISETPGTGRVVAGLSNSSADSDDELTGVRGVGEDQGLQVSLEGGTTTIPAAGLLQLAEPESAALIVEGDPERLKPGGFVRLAFTFQNAEEATLNVPVLLPGKDYGDLDLQGTGEASATPTEPAESPSETIADPSGD